MSNTKKFIVLSCQNKTDKMKESHGMIIFNKQCEECEFIATLTFNALLINYI